MWACTRSTQEISIVNRRLIILLLLAICALAPLSAQMKGDEMAYAQAQENYRIAIERDAEGFHKEAAALVRRSSAIYDSLVRVHRDSMLYVMPRARCNHLLANYYYEMNEGTRCLLAASNSVRFYNLAVSIDSAAFSEERDVAIPNLYIFLSYGYLNDHKPDLALRYVDEAFELRQSLYEMDPKLHRKPLFSTMRVRGMIMAQVGRFDEAHAMYHDAVELLDEMEIEEPGMNSHNYQSIFFNIASAYYMSGNYTDALRANMKVLKLLRQDNTQSTATKYYYLDYCYKYLGNCYWCLAYEEYVKSGNNKKSKEMLAYYQKAYDCFNMSLQYNNDDLESQGKRNVVKMILDGMEKPQKII